MNIDISPNSETNIDISDIQTLTGEDGVPRYVLDSTYKIVSWIEYNFEKQKKERKEKVIDLSRCIINTDCIDNNAWTSLSRISLHLPDDVMKPTPNNSKFAQEVFLSIECYHSIIINVDFKETLFHKTVRFVKTIFIGTSDFSGSEFKSFFFTHSSKFENCNFYNSIFHYPLELYKVDFGDSESVKFDFCQFKSDLRLDFIKFNISKENSLLSFENSTFQGEINIKATPLPNVVSFRNCNFEENVNFYDVGISSSINFNYGVFRKTFHLDEVTSKNISFRNSIIIGRVEIWNCNAETFNAMYAEIRNNGILRIHSSKIEKVEMLGLTNNGYLAFQKNTTLIKQINLENTIGTGIIELENTEIKDISNRKTARLLKDSAYKSNNVIDALEYKKIELDIYKKENIKRETRVLLWLNNISNKQGLSWTKGVLFTILVALLFFTLIYFFGRQEIIMTVNCKEYPLIAYNKDFAWGNPNEIITMYIDVLNVLKFKDRLDGVSLNGFGYIMFFFSQIGVAYGIYQTISAFRKYGKLSS